MPSPALPDLRLARRLHDLRATFTPADPEFSRLNVLHALALGEKPADIARRLKLSRAAVHYQLKRFQRIGEEEYLLRSRGRMPKVSVTKVLATIQAHRTRGDHDCRNADLAAELGCTTRTIMRAKASLRAKGFI